MGACSLVTAVWPPRSVLRGQQGVPVEGFALPRGSDSPEPASRAASVAQGLTGGAAGARVQAAGGGCGREGRRVPLCSPGVRCPWSVTPRHCPDRAPEDSLVPQPPLLGAHGGALGGWPWVLGGLPHLQA